MIKEVDEDGNGTIDFNEFVNLMKKKLRDTDLEEEYLAAFRILDRDSDGLLSAPELKHVLKNLGEDVTDQDVEEMVHEVDKDHDGLISIDEFIRLMTSK